MAFDRNNPADLASLKSEVETDPISMGYNAQNPNQLIKLINDPDDNVGGETVQGELTPETLLDSIDFSELGGNQVGEGGRRGVHYIYEVAERTENIDRWRQKVLDTFPQNGPTVAAINALTRALSRAEVLYGDGTVITKEDWFAARDS